MSERIPYNRYPDFNQSIDEDGENIVSISGYNFTPSESLYKLNYDNYKTALEVYLDDDSELVKEIYEDFPTPIAFYFYQAEENYDNPHHRLDLLKSCWEATVFVLFAIVVCEARHKNFPFNNLGIKLQDFYSDRLAIRLGIIENILESCTEGSFELKSAEIISIESISKILELNRTRNEFSHSFASNPEQRKELYEQLKPELIDVFRELRKLKTVNLFRYHSNAENVLWPRCDVFNGQSISGAKRHIRMSLADYQVILPYFNSGSIFCHIDLDLVFNLSPYFHFKKEATDTHPVLLIHKKRQTGSKYLFEVLSYSQQIELPREEFEDRDNDLRNLTI